MRISFTRSALLALVGLFLAFNQITNAQSKESVHLNSDRAVEQLKQNGSYDALLEAFDGARGRDNQRASPDEQEAVGQTARLNANDGAAGDQFGSSVAISGDTAVISAYLDDVNGNTDQGSAYVFTKTGTAAWTLQAKLVAADGAAGDLFGFSVGISADTIVVGAYRDDNGAITGQGSAYVFKRSGTTWTQQAKLTAADGAEFDLFGIGVAINGETIVVGAYFDNVGANGDQGSAYVFTRSGTMWTQRQQLLAADGAANDFFGYGLAINGETIIVGAYGDDVGTAANQGSAYVYTKTGDNWTQQTQLLAADGAAGDFFGISVSISGTTAVIGAYFDNVGANGDQGSAYVFVGSGAAWTQQARLAAADGAASDLFGYSVGISGETIIVGAYQDDVRGQNQGSAYVYMRSGTVWTQQARLAAADGAAGDAFGLSVAVSGFDLLAGSPLSDVGANDAQGSVYSYRTLTANYALETRTTSGDGGFDDHVGISVAVSGDTAVVGAYLDDVGANGDQQGSAYIFVRIGMRWRQQAQLTAADGAAFDRFGISVSIDGETAVVGAYQPSVGAVSGRGAAYVYTRSGAAWTPQAKLTAADGAIGDQFGYSVGISGETIVVGANAADIGDQDQSVDQGSAYIFTRSGAIWTQQAQLAAIADGMNDNASGDQFGVSVAINANTVAVGAVFDDLLLNAQQGSAYIFVGSGAAWTRQAKLQTPLDVTGGSANDRFGGSVAVSGDTAVVGAFFDNVGDIDNQGSAYVYTRSGAAWTQQAQLTATDGAAGDLFGNSVAIDGEIIVVGAVFTEVNANFDQGAVYIFERTGTAWAQKTRLIDFGGASNDQYGSAVAVSGDKIAVGSPNNDNTLFDGLSGGAEKSLKADDAKNRLSSPAALDQGSVLFYVNTPFAPTAAAVVISGTVSTPREFGLANALVTLTDAQGVSQTVRTGRFGNFRFTNVTAGETYVISVSSKRYAFAPQIVTANQDVADVNFTAK